MIDYTVSAHAKSRYAERIMGKEDLDITRFVILNETKIIEDVNKLINYGQLIFSGMQNKAGKTSLVEVYLNGFWVILVDSKIKNVITLYKIDLELGDDFNKEYINRMLEKLNTSTETLETIKTSINQETDIYKSLIADTEAQIKEYKTMIKNLEELCVGYKTIIDNSSVKIAQATKEVNEILNTFIGKKEF